MDQRLIFLLLYTIELVSFLSETSLQVKYWQAHMRLWQGLVLSFTGCMSLICLYRMVVIARWHFCHRLTYLRSLSLELMMSGQYVIALCMILHFLLLYLQEYDYLVSYEYGIDSNDSC